jgi:hypothetical protein
MKNPGPTLLAVAFAAAVALVPEAKASGSYCACLPKPPSSSGTHAKVDRDRYDLGQKVFNGKTAPVQGNARSQKPRLEALQGRLPAKVAAQKHLPSLAGKLTNEQLESLEYYVGERY